MLTLKNICKSYGDKEIFHNFSISFEDNKVTAILGNSGVGKTTLLNIVSGLTEYDGEVQPKPEKISYVFQSPRLIPHMTVIGNVEYVLLSKYKNKEERKNVARKYLELAEIRHLENKQVGQISGGEKQRVQLARAFCYDANLLIMDEPFSSLDFALKTRLMGLYADILQKSPRTVLFVTHDPYEALTFADDVYVLKKNGLEKFSITTPRNKRDEDNQEITAVRKGIYSALSGD